MGFFTKKVTRTKLTIKFKLLILLIVAIFLFIYYKPILDSIGYFLVARTELPATADVVLFEEEVIFRDGIFECYNLYKTKNVKDVWIIRLPDTAVIIPEYRIEKVMRESLDSVGVVFPFKFFPYETEHPYTLNKSKMVADSLKKYGYKDVILLTDGFHSRRSYEVYKKIFKDQGINLYVTTYFGEIKPDGWWTKSNGFRRVVTEYLKFFYYTVKGYI